VTRVGGGLRLLLPLGDDADEIADDDGGDDAGNAGDRGLIDRDETGADEGAGIDASIGRPHDAAMQHARHAHVMDIDEAAGRLGRQIDARHRLADDPVAVDRLQRRIGIDADETALARDEFAEGQRPVVGRRCDHHAVVDTEITHGQSKPLGGAGEQHLTRRGRRVTEGFGAHLYCLAGDRRPLIGRARRIPQNHGHMRERDIEFLGDNLAERRADASAEIDMAVEGGDPAIAADDDENLNRLAAGAVADDQQLVGTMQVVVRGDGHAAAAAARSAARMISTCVPQRQRL
jgi:hypothetical protein